MQELLAHPAVQAGVAPFAAGLVVSLVLGRLRLGGLAIAAGFAAAVYLIAGFEFTPLSTTRKILLVSLAAPVLGLALDAAHSGRKVDWLVALLSTAVVPWVFHTVLGQKEAATAWASGGAVAALLAWLAGTLLMIKEDSQRAGAAALSLGLGIGACAVLGASTAFGQYGIALGAAAGGFLLLQCFAATSGHAGATLAVSAAVITALLAGGTLLLASLPWTSMAALALVPLAVRLPMPGGAGPGMKSVLSGVYSIIPAALAAFLAWRATAAS